MWPGYFRKRDLLWLLVRSLLGLALLGCGGAVALEESPTPVVVADAAPSSPAAADAAAPDARAVDVVDAAPDATEAGDAARGMTCRECGPDTWACAAECTAIGGFITGDGQPYHCCTWSP